MLSESGGTHHGVAETQSLYYHAQHLHPKQFELKLLEGLHFQPTEIQHDSERVNLAHIVLFRSLGCAVCSSDVTDYFFFFCMNPLYFIDANSHVLFLTKGISSNLIQKAFFNQQIFHLQKLGFIPECILCFLLVIESPTS